MCGAVNDLLPERAEAAVDKICRAGGEAMTILTNITNLGR